MIPNMIEEDPLHPAFVALREGDWIEFATPNFHRIGQIQRKSGRSLLVLWQGFASAIGMPDAEIFFHDAEVPHRHTMMRRVEPQRRIEAPTGRATIAQAAAVLGTTPKGIRAMLRAGELEGRQEAGKWKWVQLPGG